MIAVKAHAQQTHPRFLDYINHPWVDSVFNTLSSEEKIAQLIMVAAFSNKDEKHTAEILKLVREQKVGGLIFFQGGPVRESKLINTYQAASKVPLLIAMDAEWGLGMRLDSTISFPYQMTLGAIQNDSLIYQMGVEVARQLKRAGVQVNFAPVSDVNNNPANPVINFRSFGENKNNVSRKAIAYMRGMEDNGIISTAKHFPGHGDTGTDSHYALPQITHKRERLDSLELYPFRQLISAGISGVMVAHLNVPALDNSGVPSTLSRPIVTELLRKELGFKGLIVTDAMNMRGVTASNPPGVVDRDAILAGNDMLEFTEDVTRTIAEIGKAIKEKKISQRDIDERCLKMLAIKYSAGLHRTRMVDMRNITQDLNQSRAKLLNRNLLQAAITVLKNDHGAIPVRDLDKVSIASISFGRNRITPFQKSLARYTQIDHFVVPGDARQGYLDSLAQKLKSYTQLIMGIHDDPGRPHNRVSFNQPVKSFLGKLALQPNTIAAVFKNPYTIDHLDSIDRAQALVVTYQDNADAEDLTAQLIFGGIGASGRLPVGIGNKFPAGFGLDVKGGIRFKYTLPEDAGMNSSVLMKGIDSLVNQALLAKATPGCQVFVARDKKVILYKAYGLHDYGDTVRVKLDDLYDLASVTKISASLPPLMKLYDEGKFSIDATLGDYLPKFKHSNKADIPLYDVLTHQARFKPFIPFWQNTIKENGQYKRSTIRPDSSRRYPIRLKDHMYLNRKYPDKMVKGIRKSPLQAEKKYVYSDFFFMLAPRVIESRIDTDFQSYVRSNFYAPLGATSVMFKPLSKYPLSAIVPTEHDYYFRHEPLHGTVHDENAIMMGGVSGHAGLFANANDLAKLMQMYLDGGEYGGRRYLKEQTLQEWTKTRFPENNNRRALGFDKPNLVYTGENSNTAKDAGAASFGHTGFTGTFAWMDPDTGLLYIFLSNRVNPTRANTRLYQLNTRTKIQQVLYDAIEK
ncbi:glycoside hydrolase family 3 N-terminal domain-containing protein [Chryseolinea sp. T2]|uniref:glycoside hydrolase family 3 N-terminal domain-containing protein n=1 Tax=Chryseolinea sp. T2 TaxID=3129255 RepID=UPI003077B155